jgi:SAM-dependent methyltransferase
MRQHGAQSTEVEHRAYFDDQLDSNLEFWRRFGRRPVFAGRRVLDLGCGHGAMSLEAARAGAKVVGVDLDHERVEFARRNLSERNSELASLVDFQTIDLIAEADGIGQFDLVLSKDTFEHVLDVESMLDAIRRLLVTGGELWAGFSPLYWSPNGDHGRTGLKMPWAHALLPRRVVMNIASGYHGRTIETIEDLNLNGITASRFFEFAKNKGFEVESALFNQGNKRFMKTFRKVRRLPVLERYFTVSVYSVMRRA